LIESTAGGFISVNTSGNTIDANTIKLSKMLMMRLMLQLVLVVVLV
jgi:hypothetical protein